jgi:hypothetical protein
MKYTPPLNSMDPNGPYVNGDPPDGIMGSIPVASTMEEHQRELVNTITNSGQTPDDGDLMQVTRALRDGKLNFRIDKGTPNTIVVDQLSPPITGYDPGLELRVLVAHSIIAGSATTIQVGDLPPAPVVRLQGTDLQPNDLMAGQIADLVSDGTKFQLQNIGIADHPPGTNTLRYEVYLPYVRDTATVANHLIGAYVPPLPDIHEGRTVEIKAKFANVGPMDFAPNNFPIHPVAHPDGTPMIAGDVVANQILLLVFDGTTQVTGYPAGVWQLISSRSAPTAVVVTRPKRSLQMQDPNAGTYGTYNLGTVPHLRRTVLTPGNQRVWTFSAFMRWPVLIPRPYWYSYDLREYLFCAGDNAAAWGGGAANGTDLVFAGGTTDTFIVPFINNSYAPAAGRTSPDNVAAYDPGYVPNQDIGTYKLGVLKDTNWHHILWTLDTVTTQQTNIWIDGANVASGAVPANLQASMNNNVLHILGGETVWSGASSTASGEYTRCRMAEVVFIDGQVLDWTHFAQKIGGVFIPISDLSNLPFGQNGFWLYWGDGSAATSTTLGKDYSGKGNNWTPYNFTTDRIHLDYPGNQDFTETFGVFTNGGLWPNGLPPGWTSTNNPASGG